jgi:hypothetical protein
MFIVHLPVAEFVRIPKRSDGILTNSATSKYGTPNVPYFLARLCRSGSQAPFSWLLATDCWMKYMPSTPSFTFG